MTKFWTKLKAWFQPTPKKQAYQPNLTKTQPVKPTNYQPINHRHYRQLIGKLAKQAIAVQRHRIQERRKL